ncbi:MAG: hypothetical protein J5687_07910 [Treponema sp.]|nr:hypothetical protein [Treponema sp.]
MKKTLHLLVSLVASLIILTACISCGSKDTGVPEENTYERVERLSGLKLTSKYNDTTRTFKAKINDSDKTITLTLPSNISSWGNITAQFSLSSSTTSMQINGTGTSYIPKDSCDTINYESDVSLGTCIFIENFSVNNFNTVVVKRDGNPNTDTYTVTINYGAMLFVSSNTTSYVSSSPQWQQGTFDTVYKAGDIITIPSTETKGPLYRHLGYSTSKTSETPEYDFGAQITVTQDMVNAGIINLYMVWSKYKLGDLVTNITDVDDKTQTGYVAYICGENDSVKAASSKPSANWRYLIVSKYGTNRLTGKTWDEANSGFSNGVYLPCKEEMNAIVENLWNSSNSRQTAVFGNGSGTDSGWNYYWTSTENETDNQRAWYVCVTTSYNDLSQNYKGYLDSIKEKSQTLNAIGISYLP